MSSSRSTAWRSAVATPNLISAFERWTSSKNSMRLRPSPLARYMAASESRNKLSAVASLSATTMPRLAVTDISTSPIIQGRLMTSRTRSAMLSISPVEASSHTTTNSSPPKRATVSPGRRTEEIRPTACRRRSSPAECPNESLMTLK